VSELLFDVVGAEGPRRFFESLTRETLGHAYLFSGPGGVGKKTFARRLAQSLLCTAPKAGVLGYDGTCSSCALFNASENARHPDFIEHFGVMKIGDSDAASGFYETEELSARDLVRQLSLQSYSGGMRVLVLGDIDFATHHAANALLKFLEEPPANVAMILTSPAAGRLLGTIRSRLVDVRFPLLTKLQVREILMRMKYDDAAATPAAALAGGSVTRAIAILEGEEESVRAQVVGWFFDAASGRTPERTWATRETLDDGLEILKALVRDWIVTGSLGGEPAFFSGEQAERLRRLRPLAGSEAVAILAKLDDAQRLARTNVSPALVADVARMALGPPATRSL
jgi:DNA polymerase III subunit delta'